VAILARQGLRARVRAHDTSLQRVALGTLSEFEKRCFCVATRCRITDLFRGVRWSGRTLDEAIAAAAERAQGAAAAAAGGGGAAGGDGAGGVGEAVELEAGAVGGGGGAALGGPVAHAGGLPGLCTRPRLIMTDAATSKYERAYAPVPPAVFAYQAGYKGYVAASEPLFSSVSYLFCDRLSPPLPL
jgi:hypothetical protein